MSIPITSEITLSVAGRAARARRAPGPGPTVVLLHGAGGNADTWAPVLEAGLPGDVWALDLPGRGGSTGPARQSAEETAAWLESVAEAAGWAAPILVGHSYGGAVALAFALQAPHRVGGLGLVASGGRLRVAPAILEAVAQATDEAPFPLDFGFGPNTPPGVVEAYGAAARTTPAASTLADWQACDRFDVLERLGEVRAKTLVLHGSEDALTPAKHQRRLAEALLRAERVELEGLGHMLPWEAPERFAEALSRPFGP